MSFKICGHSLFSQKLLKLLHHFIKSATAIVKIIQENKLRFGTIYQMLLNIIKSFQSFTNKFKGFMEWGVQL